MTEAKNPWWRSAVVYQIYPRSFHDSSGTGIGDLRGIINHLSYVKELGADAIWLSPFYPSPQVDAGYDVSDYTAVDPMFGTMDDFDLLLAEAKVHSLKVIVDLVPNHSSDQHPFFQAALKAGPGSPERAMYHFADGRGENGELPPSNWGSVFGGPSWTRVTEADGQPGQWYYHLFAREQPDFNWENPAVVDYFEDVLHFWLKRGVDGFRIDVSDALIKDTSWADTPDASPIIPKDEASGVHEIYRRFRKVLDQYDGDRMAVIETGAADDVVAQFLRPDEMHQAFNFRFLKTPWDAAQFSRAVAESLTAYESVSAPTTWVMDNHDSTRSVTRYGSAVSLIGDYVPDVSGLEALTAEQFALGTRRARAMALLLLALPGSAYIYSGQELGLPEVTDLPDEVLTDPTFFRTEGKQRGRDGCRVPMPWSGSEPPFGFSPPDASEKPWLPQPEQWRDLTVAAQTEDESSMLSWYRELLELRKREPVIGEGTLSWVTDPFAAEKHQRIHVRLTKEGHRPVEVILNFADTPVELPEGELLAASARLLPGPVADTHLLPGNTAAIVAV